MVTFSQDEVALNILSLLTHLENALVTREKYQRASMVMPLSMSLAQQPISYFLHSLAPQISNYSISVDLVPDASADFVSRKYTDYERGLVLHS